MNYFSKIGVLDTPLGGTPVLSLRAPHIGITDTDTEQAA